jgi:small GTP-binding protein
MKAKVVLIGDSGVGKTCLFERFQHESYDSNPVPTIGVAVGSIKVEENGQLVEFDIWDTAGQEKFRSIIPLYLHSSMYILVVYAVDNKQSFEHVNEWIEISKDKAPATYRFLLLANKSDLIKKEVTYEDGKKLSQQLRAIQFY